MEPWASGIFTSAGAGLGAGLEQVRRLGATTVHLHAPHRLWSLIAAGFGYFIGQNLGYYNFVHGLLYGVILLLLSAYLVAFTLLLGGELNANLVKLKLSKRAS